MLSGMAACDDNLMSSVRAWLVTTVKTPYDARVGSTLYPSPLEIMAPPNDDQIMLKTPRIIIDYPVDARMMESCGVGDPASWVSKQFFLRCYPAISTEATNAGKPQPLAANVLSGLIQTAMVQADGRTIQILDTGSSTLVGYAYIEAPQKIKPQGAINKAIAEEKHRFDYRFILRFDMG